VVAACSKGRQRGIEDAATFIVDERPPAAALGRAVVGVLPRL
jgi:hypothetical protein